MEPLPPKALSFKGRDGPCFMHIENLQGLSKNTSVKIYACCAQQLNQDPQVPRRAPAALDHAIHDKYNLYNP